MKRVWVPALVGSVVSLAVSFAAMYLGVRGDGIIPITFGTFFLVAVATQSLMDRRPGW